jgi:hypothetical protein
MFCFRLLRIVVVGVGDVLISILVLRFSVFSFNLVLCGLFLCIRGVVIRGVVGDWHGLRLRDLVTGDGCIVLSRLLDGCIIPSRLLDLSTVDQRFLSRLHDLSSLGLRWCDLTKRPRLHGVLLRLGDLIKPVCSRLFRRRVGKILPVTPWCGGDRDPW